MKLETTYTKDQFTTNALRDLTDDTGKALEDRSNNRND